MKPIIAANWKMNFTIDESLNLIDEIIKRSPSVGAEIIFFGRIMPYAITIAISGLNEENLTIVFSSRKFSGVSCVIPLSKTNFKTGQKFNFCPLPDLLGG